MSIDTFNLFLGVMSLIALFVFIALYFVKAGYGIFRTASWGVAISNKLAWILMEAPVFLVMCWMWVHSERRFDPVILIDPCHDLNRFILLYEARNDLPHSSVTSVHDHFCHFFIHLYLSGSSLPVAKFLCQLYAIRFHDLC